MHLKFDKYNDVLIVYLFGELDHHNAEVLRVKIDDRIDREGIKKVILSFIINLASYPQFSKYIIISYSIK